MVKKGDTLIEVCIAIGIFSLISIGVASVMSSGVASSQTALETTLAREEIDAQADALRFIHESYMSARNSSADPSSDPYYQTWKKITGDNGTGGSAVAASTGVTQFNPDNCANLYNSESANNIFSQKAFVLNVRDLAHSDKAFVSSASSNAFHPASIYPRLIYTGSDGTLVDDSYNANLERAEGIYIVAVRDGGTGMVISGDRTTSASAFYDFYIRTCWYGTDADRPTTISTVMRLYDPPAASDNAQGAINNHYVRIYYKNGNNVAGAPKLNYPVTRIPTGQSGLLANPNTDTRYLKYRHRFQCWSTNPNSCSGEYYTRSIPSVVDSRIYYAAPADMATDKFVDLFAIYSSNPFNVNYNANGGRFSDNATVKTDSVPAYDSREYSYSIPSQYFSSLKPSRSGYTFMGWGTSPNGSPVYTRTPATFGQLPGNVTFYAIWKANYVITYNSGAGRFSNGATTRQDICTPLAACESNYQIPTNFFSGANAPSRANYTFMGWARANNQVNPNYTSSSRTYGRLSGNVNLYAAWKPYYVITYDAGSGSFSGGAKTRDDKCPPLAACESNYYIPASFFNINQNAPTRSGYRFMGWSTRANQTVPNYTSSSTRYGRIVGNIRLYAVWVENNEQITITANWTSGNDYDSFLQLSKPNGGYQEVTWSTDGAVPVTYGNSTYNLATGYGDGRGSYNGRYYEKFVINTLGGKNYYYSISKWGSGWGNAWPNGVGNDITITVSGPYLNQLYTAAQRTFRSSSISCSNGYWNVFAFKDGRIVNRNTCTGSIDYNW